MQYARVTYIKCECSQKKKEDSSVDGDGGLRQGLGGSRPLEYLPEAGARVVLARVDHEVLFAALFLCPGRMEQYGLG
jgi:hypothetical protein